MTIYPLYGTVASVGSVGRGSVRARKAVLVARSAVSAWGSVRAMLGLSVVWAQSAEVLVRALSAILARGSVRAMTVLGMSAVSAFSAVLYSNDESVVRGDSEGYKGSVGIVESVGNVDSIGRRSVRVMKAVSALSAVSARIQEGL